MPISVELLDNIRSNHFPEETLSLVDENLIDDDVVQLVAALRQNSHVKTLNLSVNNISDRGAASLASVTTLETLDIASNNIGPEGVVALATSKLRRLNISANPIGDSVSVFALSSSLIELEARECGITDQGAETLFTSVFIKKLDLSTNELSGSCLRNIALNRVLESLCLMQNAIEREYCDYFSRNTALLTLDLTNVFVGDIGAALLAKSRTLRELTLIQCSIGDAGTMALSENTSIRKLVLLNNNIKNPGAETLFRNNHFTYLCLTSNPINTATLEMVATRYQHNSNGIFTRNEAFISQLLKKDLEEDYNKMVTPESSPDQVAAAVIVDPHYLPFFLHATLRAKENFLASLQQGIGVEIKRQKMDSPPLGNKTLLK